jgi:hypothetical protein
MTVRELVLKAEKLARDNSSSILTALGVSGTITTAYLASKASWRASKEIEYRTPPNTTLTPKEQAQAVWKLYIPAGVSASLTIVCIVGAAKINSRRTAAITAAYSLSEKAYSEYKEKVIETLGAKKEQKVRDDIAADRIANNPPQQGVMILGSGDVLCCSEYRERQSHSTNGGHT